MARLHLGSEAELDALLARPLVRGVQGQRGDTPVVTPICKVRPCPSEEQEQAALLAWAAVYAGQYPALHWLFHPANGGSRHIAEAVKFRSLGVKPGVPDLILLHPARGYHGWVGEMKAKGGKLSAPQKRWIAYLRSQGYFAEVFHGWDAARESLVWYLSD